MAEILCKVGEGSNYQDGDILCAFNRRRIRCCHAQHICHPWKAGVNADGWRPTGTHVELFYRHTCQYRFERVSRKEVKRIDQITGEEQVFSDTPVDGQAIDVEAYLEKRRQAPAPGTGPKAAIFGTLGREVWYGGRKDYSHAKLNLVWLDIETHTAHREVDFPNWPVTPTELRHMLVLPVDDFDDSTASDLVSPLLDESDPDNPVTIAKRRHHIAWRDLFPLDIPPTTSADNVLDRTKPVDPRGRSQGPYSRNSIILTKV